MNFFTQLFLNGLINGSLIALVALGLTLIYGVGRFLQFAHGELVALGAYFFMTFHKFLHWSFIPAGIVTVLCIAIIGLILEKIFFTPVRDRDPMIPLVISIGLSIGIQSLILIFYGANIVPITDETFPGIMLGGQEIYITIFQIWAVIFSFLGIFGIIWFLQKTKIGKSLRAVSCNRPVAEIFGIEINTAMRWIFGVSAGLAGIAGIFLGFEQSLTPLMGLMISVKAFSAIVLGAVGSVRGAILGAFLISFTESFLVGYGVIPSGFSAAIPFLVLIFMLLIRPEGIFGKRFTAVRQ